MVKDIEVEAGPIFALLRIVPDGFPGHPIIIRFLKKKDALKIRRVIQGLMVAKRHGVDFARLDEAEFEHKLELLGTTHLVE